MRDLPKNGKPNSFTGAVGQFEFDVILNKKSLRATESFQAELKVKGSGNLKLFDLPNMLVPNSMELFEPEREESINTNLSGMSGSVSKYFTVIPRFQGNFPIEEVEFSYFDPSAERYKILKSPRLTVDVFDGPTYNNPSTTNDSNVITFDDSFRFIKLKGNLNEFDDYKFFESELFYILSSTPFVLSLALFAFAALKRNRKKSYSETIKYEEKRIYNLIDSAKKLTNEKTQFYDIIEKSIIKCLMVKFSIRMESLNKEKIQEITENKGLSAEHISQIINLIKNCEKAKYSRSSDSAMNKDLENARKVVGIIMKAKS